MKTKQEIVENWLPRYTQMPLDAFGSYILLTNFNNYVDIFCDNFEIEKPAYTSNMRCATADGITIINFGMGSPNAAIIMDLLSAISPKACLFLGKCGGISTKTQRGDLVLPPEVPALPAFMLQRAVSSAIRDLGFDYWTGTVYTTNRRVWEHDDRFKEYLKTTHAMAVDMETATLFTCGFANHIPTGALLLVSDNPMTPEGVKTSESDRQVTASYVVNHINIGIQALEMIKQEKKTVRHLKFDY